MLLRADFYVNFLITYALYEPQSDAPNTGTKREKQGFFEKNIIFIDGFPEDQNIEII